MRFLLHAFQRSSRSTAAKNSAVKRGAKKVEPATPSSSTPTKTWGQQCGQDCGCVVRFESCIDETSQRIISSKYEAKAVVATRGSNGILQPVLTTTTHKPMFQECNCQTLHLLASEITAFLPNRTVNSIRNMTQFSNTRAPPAFRHSVLARQNLPRSHTYCFDLVEEAFTAMINGTMPRSRRNQRSFQVTLQSELIGRSEADDAAAYPHGDGVVATLESENARPLWTPSSASSTLNMFDINAENWDRRDEHSMEEMAYPRVTRTHKLDWVSYVDEQNSKFA